MARSSSIKTSLDRALRQASIRIVREALANLPARTSMGDIIDEFSRSQYKNDFRSLTVAEFLAALGGEASARAVPAAPRRAPASKVSGSRKKSYNTRTAEGRARLDAAISAFLQRVGSAGSETIQADIGGKTAQVREACKRLMKAGRVTKQGQKRATVYIWKGGGKGGASASSETARKKTTRKKAKRRAKKRKK